jgi:hypothetical protein
MSPLFHPVIAWIVGGFLTSSVAIAAATNTSQCRQAANESGLERAQVERLCAAAKDNIPIQCFNHARDHTPLSAEQAITLCQCARSTAAADCVASSLRIPGATADDAMLFCEDPERRSVAEQSCLGANEPVG